MVKNPPANAEDLSDAGSILSWKDPLEEAITYRAGRSHEQSSLVGYNL